MTPLLAPTEIRIIACLMEKSITTPEQYPLTLNALVSACNQKSSRNPVMALKPGTVQQTARELEVKKFISIEENFKRGVEKYTHRFYTSTYGSHKFDETQFAIMCLLMLRGPQTPGELRARSSRLHSFADNSAVVLTLASLMEGEREPLVVKLPRVPGRKDSEYTHLFAGPVDIEAYEEQAKSSAPTTATKSDKLAELTQRVAALEADMAELKTLLKR